MNQFSSANTAPYIKSRLLLPSCRAVPGVANKTAGRGIAALLLVTAWVGTAHSAFGQSQPVAAPADKPLPQTQQSGKPAGTKEAAGGKDNNTKNNDLKTQAAKEGQGAKNAAAKDKQSKDTAGGGQSKEAAGGNSEDPINADRPGIADGSQVIGPHRFQIEAGIEEDFLGGGKTTQRLLTVPTLLRFGINDRYELRIESSGYANLSSTAPLLGTQHTDGSNPISIGFKRQFQASSGARHPGVGAIARLYPGSGGGMFRTSHATYDVRAAADWDFAPHLSLNPNIGVGNYEDDAGRLFGVGLLATTLTYAPTTRLGFFADYGLQTRQTSSSATSLIYDGGVTYIVGSNVQLDVAVGTGALGQTTPHPFWSAGVSIRF